MQAGILVGHTADQEVQGLIGKTASGRRHLEIAAPRDAETAEIAARLTVIHVLVPGHPSGFADGPALLTTLNLRNLMQLSF